MRVLIISLFIALAAVSACLGKPRSSTRSRHFHRRIVGGEEVTPGQLPFQVSLQWEGSHFCGGSILTENVILTAAHCLYGYEDDPYVIVAGEHSLTRIEGNEQTRDASALVLHEGYNDRTFVNDVALMWVDVPFEFNDFVQPIELPEPFSTASGPAPVSGWGTTAEGGQLSDVLRVVTLDIITDQLCRDKIPGNPGQVVDHMICAYYQPGGKDSCQGDSGGPLMSNTTGETEVVGIVSWGYGCAREDMPGVYTEVSYFVDWINAQIDARRNK